MRSQTRREEIANTITHGIGVLLSAAGGLALLMLAISTGSAWKIAGVSVFVVSLLVLYSASTTYHAVRPEPLKQRLKIVDHCAIFMLIAGTYTPFMLDAMRGPWGWSLFAVVWTLALVGMVLKLRFAGQYPRVSTAIYIAMGWLIVVAAGPMLRSVALDSLAWLLAGGIVYTAGTVFYHSRRIPFAHAVWHMFVVAGSVCHGIAVAVQL